MPSRLSWRAPKNYTPAAFDNLILAINQRLDELSVAARAADPTASAPLPVITNVVNNLVIGRGTILNSPSMVPTQDSPA